MAGGTFPPSIELSRPYNISGANATVDGTVLLGSNTGITQRGIIINTVDSPTSPVQNIVISGTNGSFTKAIASLVAGTRYYIIGFVKYQNYSTGSNSIEYSESKTFIAGDPSSAITPPVVDYVEIEDVTQSSAHVSSYLYDDGGATVTERGFVYSTSPNPTVANSKIVVEGDSQQFAADIVGRNPSTVYHVRSYAQNSAGRSYSEDFTFTTLATPLPIVGDWKVKIDTSKGDGLAKIIIYYVGATDFDIDWGDGQSNLNISGSGSVTHNYAAGGIKTITMTGYFDSSNTDSGVSFGGRDTSYPSAPVGSVNNMRKVIETSVVGGIVGVNSMNGVFTSSNITTIPQGIFDKLPNLQDFSYSFMNSTVTNIIPFWFLFGQNSPFYSDSYTGTPARDLSAIPEDAGGGGTSIYIDPVVITKEALIAAPESYEVGKVNIFNTLEIKAGVVARFDPSVAHQVTKLIANGALIRSGPSSYDDNDNPLYEERHTIMSSNAQTINNADIKDSKAIGAIFRNLNGKDSGNNLGWVFNATDDPNYYGEEEWNDDNIVKPYEPPVEVDIVRIHSSISPFGRISELRPIAIEKWEESIESDTSVEIVIDRDAALELIATSWKGAYSFIVSLVTNTIMNRYQFDAYSPFDDENQPPAFESNVYDSFYVTSIAPDENSSNYRISAVGFKGYLQKRLAIPASRDTTNGTVSLPDGTVDTKPIAASQMLNYTGKSYKGIIVSLLNETQLLQSLPVGYFASPMGGPDLLGTVQRVYLLKDFQSIAEAIDNMLDDQGAPAVINFDGGYGDRDNVKFFFEIGKKAPPAFQETNILNYFYKGTLSTQINDRSSNAFLPDVQDQFYDVTNNLWSVGNAADGNVLLCHKTSGNAAQQVLLQEVNTENSDIKTSTYLLNYTNAILAKSGQSVRTMTLKTGLNKEMFFACAGNFITFDTPTRPEIDGTRWRVVHRTIGNKEIDFDLAEDAS